MYSFAIGEDAQYTQITSS